MEPLVESSVTVGASADASAATGTEDVQKYMSCSQCENPILRADELIEEKLDIMKEAVYPYELDVCERECWCYSATNPGDVRFDVIRVLPTALGVVEKSTPVLEHSWFPGFAWTMCHCDFCHAHLGWGFRSPASSQHLSSTHASERKCDAALDSSASDIVECSDSIREDDVPAVRHEATSGESGDEEKRQNSGSVEECSSPPKLWSKEASFYGLVLTKLREKSLTESEVRELREREQPHYLFGDADQLRLLMLALHRQQAEAQEQVDQDDQNSGGSLSARMSRFARQVLSGGRISQQEPQVPDQSST
eukprot:TRINITY_DN28350_c0_g1_i1.p1 TRINITY_DN28350_c0_g1~~TRINITY_DN28350_c0_g1_i1.p1  ORF type:complete len:319 (+),score=43.50 TRINITY_DN28350_c0_g1_i1:38-958(+)